MRTYLELEGKLGPKPRHQPQQNQNQQRSTQPSTNPLVRRGTKTNDKYGLDNYSSSESESHWEEKPKHETVV